MSTTTKTAAKACKNCAFWNPQEEGHGECRRHAPHTVAFDVDEEVHFESVFPMTTGEDWCGDFENQG
ncbi:high-potential iron-sulfur protein [Haloferula sp. BvORR071]|uniref:high-potential iron-sulfur protein n=1 Tax=Haloferula sp. BvORR071 TaxID=1396141 RepID=UPI000552AD98|nr:high-potential iron-sulfur protein [Haloferula sp. BvORR071]